MVKKKAFVGPKIPKEILKKRREASFVGPKIPKAILQKRRGASSVGATPTKKKRGASSVGATPTKKKKQEGERKAIVTAKGERISAKESLRRNVESKLRRARNVRELRQLLRRENVRTVQQLKQKLEGQRVREQIQSLKSGNGGKLDKQILETARRINNLKGVNTFRAREEMKAQQNKLLRLRGVKSKAVNQGFITADEKPTKTVDKLLKKLKTLVNKRSTKSIRTKQTNIKNELSLLGFVAIETVVSGVVGVVALPKTLFNVARNPAVLKKVPASIKKSAANFGQMLRLSPTESLARIGGEIVFLSGTGKALTVTGKVGGNTATRLSPFFRKVKSNKIEIKTTSGRTTLKVGGSVKKIQEPLKTQAKIAGKKVTAVSVQADRLVNFIRTQRVVRKPIPGEKELSARVKGLLSKFDKGTISKKELIELESKVNVLERSFFADPRGRFRPTRLGAEPKEASLVDLLSGDFTFKASKPQILVFENVRVAKFPKALKDVEKALKTGKTLTQAQSKRLLDFQLKKGGKFKPVGALTKEPEITLAPGEVIKRVKKMGVTIINGKRVEIIQAKVIKPTGKTKSLLKKAKEGKLTPKELKELNKKLKKETGFKPSLSRSTRKQPRARLPKRGLKAPRRKVPRRIRTRRRIIPRPKTTRRTTTPTRITRGGTARTTTTRRTTRGGTARRGTARRGITPPPPRRLIRPVGTGKVVKGIVTPSKKKKRFKKKATREKGFNVFAKPIKTLKGKKAKRLIKVNKVALSKKRARDLRNYITDTSLSRTATIRPTSGKPKTARLKVPRGYAKKTNRKFRRFRIRKGVKRTLPKHKVIERSRHLLDTKQEKKKITLRKRIREIRKKTKRR